MAKYRRPFQRPQVGDILDHHDRAGIAARVTADRAGVDGVDIAADGFLAGEEITIKVSQRSSLVGFGFESTTTIAAP